MVSYDMHTYCIVSKLNVKAHSLPLKLFCIFQDRNSQNIYSLFLEPFICISWPSAEFNQLEITAHQMELKGKKTSTLGLHGDNIYCIYVYLSVCVLYLLCWPQVVFTEQRYTIT